MPHLFDYHKRRPIRQALSRQEVRRRKNIQLIKDVIVAGVSLAVLTVLFYVLTVMILLCGTYPL